MFGRKIDARAGRPRPAFRHAGHPCMRARWLEGTRDSRAQPIAMSMVSAASLQYLFHLRPCAASAVGSQGCGRACFAAAGPPGFLVAFLWASPQLLNFTARCLARLLRQALLLARGVRGFVSKQLPRFPGVPLGPVSLARLWARRRGGGGAGAARGGSWVAARCGARGRSSPQAGDLGPGPGLKFCLPPNPPPPPPSHHPAPPPGRGPERAGPGGGR